MSNSKDIITPRLNTTIGGLHPINSIMGYILNELKVLGFDVINGPEIETEEYNFDMLNIRSDHPARQMHDTFYLDNKQKVLRTHTSPVQIRAMLNNKPPFGFVSGGKVYRKDDDSTHLPMFHQILIYDIIQSLFGNNIEIRFRPSYFPFTEPSAEVDILSEEEKWLEVLGCGIINPRVLENCGIDSKKFSGLAFGLGVERIAMLKYGVNDIRDFYKSNLDFLSQFK